MSLPHYRQKLKSKLLAAERNRFMIPVVLEAIDNWWNAYKDWEAEDSFEKAFRERRMTARTMRYDVVHQPLTMIRASEPEKGKQEVGGKSSTGIKGLMQRMDPEMFQSDRRLKYVHGLHDMSSSLLDPGRQIDKQLYGHAFRTQSKSVTRNTDSKYEDGLCVVFMPVSLEEDLAMFLAINSYAKHMRAFSEPLNQKVRQIKSMFTRIKLAEEKDSHIGFVDVSAKDALPMGKYRYGLTEAEARSGDWSKTEERRAAAAHFTSLDRSEFMCLINGQQYHRKSYNEIIVAYRQHANPVFPVITRWIATGRGDDGYFRVQVLLGDSVTDDHAARTISRSGECVGL